MKKLKHYFIGYSLVLLINAGMLAVVCPKAKASLNFKKDNKTELTILSGETIK